MLISFSSIFAHLWIVYGADIVTAIFWSFVGLAIISPVMLLDAVYQVHKIGNGYSFREGYHLKRSQHKRDAVFYGLVLALVVLCFIALIY